jgi:hypothetical protein
LFCFFVSSFAPKIDIEYLSSCIRSWVICTQVTSFPFPIAHHVLRRRWQECGLHLVLAYSAGDHLGNWEMQSTHLPGSLLNYRNKTKAFTWFCSTVSSVAFHQKEGRGSSRQVGRGGELMGSASKASLTPSPEQGQDHTQKRVAWKLIFIHVSK